MLLNDMPVTVIAAAAAAAGAGVLVWPQAEISTQADRAKIVLPIGLYISVLLGLMVLFFKITNSDNMPLTLPTRH